jgi:predicted permease
MPGSESPRIPRGIRRALRLPSSRERLARELDDEVEFHLELRVAELMARGMAEAAARAEAARRFGDPDDLREYCQSIEVPHMRRLRFRDWAESWMQDLRFTLRYFKRSPGFVAITIATLGLGIGAATSIFSVVNGVLLRSLPYQEANRIMQVWELDKAGAQMQFADPNFSDLQAQSRSFAALAQFNSGAQVPIVVAGEAVRAQVAEVSRDFFTVFPVQPIRGRLFAPDEQRAAGPFAAVISEGLWRRQFGASPSAIGSRVAIGDLSLTIVGVMPIVLDFPAGTEMWLSREATRGVLTSRTAHNWQVVGRLADGVSIEQARREAGAIAQRLKAQYGDYTAMVDVDIVPLREQMVGKMREPLYILLGASVMLLLIACANVVNLLVARMAARQGEIAVRRALGAAGSRLAQQCFVESLLLALGSAAVGVVIAQMGVALLLRLEPTNLPRVREVRVDLVVLGFAIGAAMLAALVLGLLSAWWGARADLRAALSQSQRTQAGSGAGVRRTLVVVQIAMTLVLLVGASLLGRSLANVLSVDPGFRATRAVVLDVWVGDDGPQANARRFQFYDALLERVRAIPGVTGVGAVNVMPLSSERRSNGTFLIMSRLDEKLTPSDFERLAQDRTRTGDAEYRLASDAYFSTIGIPVLRGRAFDGRDTRESQPVAVISASLAKARWPNENPIGKIIQFGNMDGDLRPFIIVGVVGDVREANLAAPPRPTFYGLYRQRPQVWRMSIVIATSGQPAPLIASARRIVRELRPDVPPRFRTIDMIVTESVADRRFMLLLAAVFGGAALLLAALGVYSVISYLVTLRSRELSIRVAVGARAADIIRLVLGQGTALAMIGVIVGTLGAVAATRVIAGLLYGITPTDPLTFAGVAVLVAFVALLASYLPARRAAKVDAMEVLRGGA